MGQSMIAGPSVDGYTERLPNPCLRKIYFALHARRSAHRLALAYSWSPFVMQMFIMVFARRSAHRPNTWSTILIVIFLYSCSSREAAILRTMPLVPKQKLKSVASKLATAKKWKLTQTRKRLSSRLASRATDSHSSLVAIQNLVASDPEFSTVSVSRRDLYRALDDLWGLVGTHLPLPQRGRPDFKWEIIKPQTGFQHLSETTDAFRHLVRQTLQRKPNTRSVPWEIVLHWDEVTPGMELKLDNKRKELCISWSFVDFGPEALCHAEAWVVLGILRSNIISKTPGALGCVLRVVLELFFCGPDGFSQVGVPIDVGGFRVIIFAGLGNIVVDWDALYKAFNHRGPSCVLPCMLCKNVLLTRLRRACQDPTRYFVELHAPLQCCDLCTDADIWQKVDSLVEANNALIVAKGKPKAKPKAKAKAKPSLAELEKASGFSCELEGAVFSISL